MARKTKWKGWLKPEDVKPDLLKRILEYNERYKKHLAKLGSNEHWEAHNRARVDVPLTAAEFDIKQRLLT
jgi:hypothetical protein